MNKLSQIAVMLLLSGVLAACGSDNPSTDDTENGETNEETNNGGENNEGGESNEGGENNEGGGESNEGGENNEGGGESSEGGETVTPTTSFPNSLAVASPFAGDASGGATSAGRFVASALSSDTTSRYNWALTQINTLLTAESAEICAFNPELFLSRATNASCYGPAVAYQNHPDAGDGDAASGTLPTGDVGIWTETDAAEGHGCAAAQLNARMGEISDTSFASLMSLASMICTINTNESVSMPANSTTDLSAVMPTTGMTAEGTSTGSIAYTTATLSHDDTSGSDVYTYVLDLTYDTNNPIYVRMQHTPGAAATEYEGLVSYRVPAPVGNGNCGDSDAVTYNGSLWYDRDSASAISVQLRSGEFCGDGENGNGLDSNFVVNVADKYNGTVGTGWANNFNLLNATYNPISQVGDYCYGWQAGSGDGNVRAFNVAVTEDSDDTTNDLHADAFFGYGNDIATLDPNIKGMICNWAGPGNSHALTELAQHQELDFNTTTSKFDATNSNIRYAPTNSCSYDGSGTFTYDSDGDGSADTVAADAVAHNLIPPTGDGIESTITAMVSCPALAAQSVVGLDPDMPTIYLRGSMNEFAATEASAMTEVSPGVLGVSVALTASSTAYTFKLADADYTAEYNYGGGEQTIVGTECTRAAYAGSQADLRFVVTTGGTFDVRLDLSQSPAMVSVTTADGATSCDEPDVSAEPVYLRGSMNGFDTSQVMAQETSGIFTTSVALNVQDYEFKVADATYGAYNYGSAGIVGLTCTLNMDAASANNARIRVTTAGTFNFSFDTTSDPAVLTVTSADGATSCDEPTTIPDLYLRGTISTWDSPPAANAIFTKLSEGVYQLDYTATAAAYEFKIADAGWSSATNYGAAAGATVTLGEAISLQAGSNTNLAITIPADGSYRFAFDISGETPTLTVTTTP